MWLVCGGASRARATVGGRSSGKLLGGGAVVAAEVEAAADVEGADVVGDDLDGATAWVLGKQAVAVLVRASHSDGAVGR